VQTVSTIDYDVQSRGRRQKAGADRPVTRHTHRATRAPRRQLDERTAPGGPVAEPGRPGVLGLRGEPIHPAVSRTLRAAGEERPGCQLSVHDWRHTHATIALQAGISPKVVQERLGHSTVALTLDIYSHVIPSMEEAAAERVAALVFGAR